MVYIIKLKEFWGVLATETLSLRSQAQSNRLDHVRHDNIDPSPVGVFALNYVIH